MKQDDHDRLVRIQALNDQLRCNPNGGQLYMTSAIVELEPKIQVRLMCLIRTFSDFNEENDPHGEHDFGAIDLEGERYFFKIDYYNHDLTMHSEDAADPSVTIRVMTIMRADEY